MISILRPYLLTFPITIDRIEEDQIVKVKVLDVDQRGRIKLSIKELLEKPAPKSDDE